MRYLFHLLLLVAIVATSCDSSKTKTSSTGRGGEVVVVCNQGKWEQVISPVVYDNLKQEMIGLPESEPEFNVINISENSFGRMLQTHHNLLIVEISPTINKAKVETLENIWSYPQRVIKVLAPSDSAFRSIYAKHAVGIRHLFLQNERLRMRGINATERNASIEKTLLEDFGIKMEISKDFFLAKKTSEFAWLRQETTLMSLGLMIYTYPYTDTAQLAPNKIYEQRNVFTQKYIPGPTNGSYMIMEYNMYKPESAPISFNDLYAVETRGLWKTFGDFMGGPFINFTIVDAPRNRIIVFDGYVYNPNKDKRNFVRQLESIIWTASFTNPTNKKIEEKK